MDKLSIKYLRRPLKACRKRNHKICLKKYVCTWPIAKFFCHAKLGRYRDMADIEQAFTPFNLAEATD